MLQAGVLPVVHGSALGQQGLSQELVTSTIGDDGSAAKSEGITGETRQQLMVQLNTRVAAATEVQPSSSACYKCTAPGILIPQIDPEPLVQVFSGFLVQALRQYRSAYIAQSALGFCTQQAGCMGLYSTDGVVYTHTDRYREFASMGRRAIVKTVHDHQVVCLMPAAH